MEQLRRRGIGFFNVKIILSIFFSVMCIDLSVMSFHGNDRNATASATANSGYIVIDANTNKVILKENERISLPMASTTKIMTALIAIENCKPEEKVIIPKEATNIEGSSVYLKESECLTVEELLYCLMLRSGNDSAAAIALHLCDSIEKFAEMMNMRAKSLNLSNSNFMNPHGLHDENHYTSCYDLAIIASKAMEYPLFRKIVNTKQVTIGQYGNTRVLINKNKMLKLMSDANGIKTGYTKKAGRCLVSSAERNGRTLICVVLNCPDMYSVSINLLEKGFELINR